MDSLTAARAQMEVSLGFHMVFAALGIGMPLLMVLAEGLYLRTGRVHYRHLARRWGTATALLFVVGAVSGTALSFELGLLWPRFMRLAGPAVGPAFALEGFAFFVEAIFVGLYLYGWDRLSPRAHWLAGFPVAISGAASGAIVVAANAWMQHPVGLTTGTGGGVAVDPGAVLRNPTWFRMALHSTLACYVAVGFAVAGVYAVAMLRGRRDAYHRSGLTLAMALAAIGAVLQPLSGDLVAGGVARDQPVKLAAMEAVFRDEVGAAGMIGGIPDAATGEVRFAIKIPRLLSLLAYHDPDARVRGLQSFPADQRPNVLLVHLAYQLMLMGAGGMAAVAGLFWFLRWRRGRVDTPWALRAAALCGPLGFVALEAGWVVSEAGRQPWAVYGVMRTRDAVTPAAGVPLTFAVFSALYVGLAVALVVLLRRLGTGAPPADEADAQTAGAGTTHGA